MSLLYISADQIGIETGGGLVTKHESQALQELGPCEILEREELQSDEPEPWKWDDAASDWLSCWVGAGEVKFKLCHIYSGTFSKAVAKLKADCCKVCFTVAAHDRKISQQAHTDAGLPFPYLHLTDPALWERYSQGYKDADVVVCPSKRAAEIVADYPRTGRIAVIPHGCDLPAKIKPLPKRFVAGYMGSYGCDKSVITLVKAWKKLAFKDAVLILAGRDSATDSVHEMVGKHGGGAVILKGWVEDVSEFYDQISCLVQPSQTEGFGLEVVEALAHGRPVICSDGAGAADVVTSDCGFVFRAGSVDELADRISWYKASQDVMAAHGQNARQEAVKYAWPIIRKRYQDLWKEMLA